MEQDSSNAGASTGGGASASPLLGAGVGGGAMQAQPSSGPEGPGAPPAAPTPSFTDKMLSQAQGRYDAMKKEVKRIGAIRAGLDKVLEKGDAVTSDDVLDEMALLVAKGADPKMFAAMMAGNAQEGVGPMPPQGEALAKWLEAVHTDMLAPYEAQLRPALALAQHQLGVAALHGMVDAHAQRGAPAQQGAPAPSNMAPLSSPLLH